MDELRYSEESEGTELREFVDRVQANQDPSPRSALLSPQSDSSSFDRQRRSTRSERYRRDRKRLYSNYTSRELVKLLVEEEYEVRELRRAYNQATDRLEAEMQRANYAEQRVLDMAQRFRESNDLRVMAELAAAHAKEELALYKIQLDTAQKEILRAQDLVKDVEAAKQDAEDSAARARHTARKLIEERLVFTAREEGRRMGYEEGITRGRSEGYKEGKAIGYGDGRRQMRDEAYRVVDKAWAEEDGDEDDEEDGLSQGLPPRMLNFAPSPVNDDPPSPRRRRRRRPWGIPEYPSDAHHTNAEAGPSRTAQSVRYDSPGPTAPVPITEAPSRMPNTVSPIPTRHVSLTYPLSVHNAVPSPRHPEFNIPPEGWVPPTGEDNVIRLPPPHEMFRTTPSPGPTRSPSLGSTYLSHGRAPSPSVPPVPPPKSPVPLLTRDYINELHSRPSFPVPASVPDYPDSVSSGSHARHGAGSLGLHGFPKARQLSIISEGASERGSIPADDQRRGAYRPVTPQGPYSSEYARPDGRDEDSPRDRERLADNLRYSDSSLVKSARKARKDPRPTTKKDGPPPSWLPSNLSTPPRLANPALDGHPRAPSLHQRSFSLASPRRTPQPALDQRSGHRRSASSDPPPQIFVQSPSTGNSRHSTEQSKYRNPNAQHSGYYRDPGQGSPLRSAHSPLPRSSTLTNQETYLSDGRAPSRSSFRATPSPRQSPLPVPEPVPQPYYAARAATPNSAQQSHRQASLSRAGTPVSAAAGPSSAGWSPRSPSSHRMQYSTGGPPWSGTPKSPSAPLQYTNAGATPGGRLTPLPPDTNKSPMKRISSVASLGSASSYGRYDPKESLDPANFIGSDLLQDRKDKLSASQANSPAPKMTRLRSVSPAPSYQRT